MRLWAFLNKQQGRRNEAHSASGALLKLANLPPKHWLSRNTSTDERHFSQFNPGTKPGKKGVPLLIFLTSHAAKVERDSDGGHNGVWVGRLCPAFILAAAFLIDYTPIVSFIFLSNQWLFFFCKKGGFANQPSRPPPFSNPLGFLQMASAAHTSALCANHARRLFCLSSHTNQWIQTSAMSSFWKVCYGSTFYNVSLHYSCLYNSMCFTFLQC